MHRRTQHRGRGGHQDGNDVRTLGPQMPGNMGLSRRTQRCKCRRTESATLHRCIILLTEHSGQTESSCPRFPQDGQQDASQSHTQGCARPGADSQRRANTLGHSSCSLKISLKKVARRFQGYKFGQRMTDGRIPCLVTSKANTVDLCTAPLSPCLSPCPPQHQFSPLPESQSPA